MKFVGTHRYCPVCRGQLQLLHPFRILPELPALLLLQSIPHVPHECWHASTKFLNPIQRLC